MAIPYFQPPPILPELMFDKRCVAYVGAGFSRACGMPDWWGLVERLIAYGEQWLAPERLLPARAALDSTNLPMAASLVKEILTPSLINECLSETFGSVGFSRADIEARRRMTYRMYDLVRATWAGIVTTNYDNLIEQALAPAIESTHWVNDVQIHGDTVRLAEALTASGQEKLFFVKLHGSLGGPRVVLTTEDYDEAYLRSPRISTFLSALMLHYHVLFIGCSLEDEIVRLRRRLSGDFEGHIPIAYALLPGDPSEPANQARAHVLKNQARIEVIWFRKDPTFSGLDQFLAFLADLPKPPEDFRSMHRFRRYEDRKSRLIGKIRNLLDYIANEPGQTITRKDLADRIDSNPPLKEQICGESVEDELKYRLLYLSVLGMLNETPEDDTFRYAVPGFAIKSTT
jgi:hypothetical protein